MEPLVLLIQVGSATVMSGGHGTGDQQCSARLTDVAVAELAEVNSLNLLAAHPGFLSALLRSGSQTAQSSLSSPCSGTMLQISCNSLNCQDWVKISISADQSWGGDGLWQAVALSSEGWKPGLPRTAPLVTGLVH